MSGFLSPHFVTSGRPKTEIGVPNHFGTPTAAAVFWQSIFERSGEPEAAGYLTWAETSLVISNIVTWLLPPKTAFSFSSALMLVFFAWS